MTTPGHLAPDQAFAAIRPVLEIRGVNEVGRGRVYQITLLPRR
jgi:hypothetical protein